jgi:16S rRNA (guanine527-N7)-methyltransferase
MNDLVRKYFKDITEEQSDKFDALLPLYRDWNSKINVISRKDIDNFTLHHLLHSLGIAVVTGFRDGTAILDAGTGGGFPGIPLAIMFPNTSFTLVDSIRKKTTVVEAVAGELKLANVRVVCSRVEEIPWKFDFVISRAVTAFPKFVEWTMGKLIKGGSNSLANGILYLKGGDLTGELLPFKNRVKVFDLEQVFDEEFFKDKKVVYLPA